MEVTHTCSVSRRSILVNLFFLVVVFSSFPKPVICRAHESAHIMIYDCSNGVKTLSADFQSFIDLVSKFVVSIE